MVVAALGKEALATRLENLLRDKNDQRTEYHDTRGGGIAADNKVNVKTLEIIGANPGKVILPKYDPSNRWNRWIPQSVYK